jgi:hypothetical protein
MVICCSYELNLNFLIREMKFLILLLVLSVSANECARYIAPGEHKISFDKGISVNVTLICGNIEIIAELEDNTIYTVDIMFNQISLSGGNTHITINDGNVIKNIGKILSKNRSFHKATQAIFEYDTHVENFASYALRAITYSFCIALIINMYTN